MLPLVQPGVRVGAKPAQAVRIGEHQPFAREHVVFALQGRDAIELLELKGRHLDARALLPLPQLRPLERAHGRTPRRMASGDDGDRIRMSGERIEQSHVLGGIEQRLVLVLTVQIDAARAELPQRRRRREHIVDEGTAASLGRDLAAHDDVRGAPVLEDRLHGGEVLARSNEIRAGAAAHEQIDRFDQHRLARAGFAGQDVQAGFEFDLEPVEDRQMAYSQESKHVEAGTPILSNV